jgi:hypothetical protein
MALTLSEAKIRLRRMINEAVPAMFTDDDLYDIISDAQQDLCADTDCVCALTSFNLSDGVHQYDLPTGTQRIFQAWWVDGDSFHPIELADDSEAIVLYGTKQRSEARSAKMIRRSPDICEFRPVPDTNKECYIYRSYEPAAISLSADTFSVRDSWIRKGVLPLAAARCFERTGEQERATLYKGEYSVMVNDIKKQVDRWGIRGNHQAQFPLDVPGGYNHPLDQVLR